MKAAKHCNNKKLVLIYFTWTCVDPPVSLPIQLPFWWHQYHSRLLSASCPYQWPTCDEFELQVSFEPCIPNYWSHKHRKPGKSPCHHVRVPFGIVPWLQSVNTSLIVCYSHDSGKRNECLSLKCSQSTCPLHQWLARLSNWGMPSFAMHHWHEHQHGL